MSEGMKCHNCGRRHTLWEKAGERTVDDGHHAGILKRWQCEYCGGYEEVAHS